MSHDAAPRRNLESLKKEAKRWLAALRANDADARARLERAVPGTKGSPGLRNVQLALAREHGFDGWAALKAAIEQAQPDTTGAGAEALARYQTMADALLEAYHTGTPEAMERHYRYTWHRRAEHLESLILMYCRHTTDAATEHLAGLRHLTEYFNSYTAVTDRTPDLLSTLESLERVTLDTCHCLTNAGVARLARLPRLLELRVSGRGITLEVARAFRPGVIVAAGG
jgi:hypothetical protein